METKKSKVKSVQQNAKNYAGKFGTVFIHKVTFENGDSGEFHSKSETCEKFKEGQEYDYTIEKKENVHNGQTYTNYYIKPVESNNGSGFKAAQKDEGVITALSCISSACNAVQHSSSFNNTALILSMADEFFKYAISKSSKK
ncbi:MAG: hypothetical protein ACK5QC_04310 [Bacteroidota bacterium]|jgi:hypothetical protein